MSQGTIARRYALALYNEALRQNAVSEVDADMVALQTSLNDSRELGLFFKSPVVNRDKKQAILKRLFTGNVSATTLNFMLLCVNKGRDSMIPEMLQGYQTLRDGHLGMVAAHVKMAYQPSEEEKAALQAKLESMTGKKVRMSIEQDETLIGGAVVRVGDTMYDGSVRRQLSVLKDRLTHGSYLNN
jgi:F-type H+-transporting ATPase subunit delta